jgi:hypothetical protein
MKATLENQPAYVRSALEQLAMNPKLRSMQGLTETMQQHAEFDPLHLHGAADVAVRIWRKEFTDEATVSVWMDYLKSVDLTTALWWFIEQTNEDTPGRSDIFFYLRERVREGK